MRYFQMLMNSDGIYKEKGGGGAYIKERLILVMAYTGAVVGAGFASGQEIVQFFVSYGIYGFKGVIVASVFFSLCASLLMYLAHQRKVSTYQDVLALIFGHKLGPLVDLSVAIFLFLGISTMLSASGAIFQEHLYLPKGWGIAFAFTLIAIFLVTGKKGLVRSYNILVPIKIVLLLAITIYAAMSCDNQVIKEYTCGLPAEKVRFWLISSILYVGYNFALAMVILAEYQPLSDKKSGIAGGAWGGLVLGLLLLSTYLALSKNLPDALGYEVPILYIAGNISLSAKHFYILVLWVGILTTAIANTYGFVQRFAKFVKLKYKLCLIITLLLALPLSTQDFSLLVGHIYPLFGILGSLIMIFLFRKAIKDISSELYYNIIQYKRAFRGKK